MAIIYNGQMPATSMGMMGKRHIDDGQDRGPFPIMAIDWRKRLTDELARQKRDMKELSLSAGLGETYIRDALKRGRGGKVENLQKIALALGKSANWLLGDEELQRPRLVESYDPDAIDPLEQYGDDRPAFAPRPEDFPKDAILEAAPRGGLGSGETALTAYAREIDGVSEVDAVRADYWRFPQRFLNETLRRPATALLVIECEGDSMSPTLAPGERVWVDITHKIPTPDGIYAMRDRFDNIVVKRVQLDESGDEPMLLIISDNPSHSTIRRRLDDVVIYGKVVGGFKLF